MIGVGLDNVLRDPTPELRDSNGAVLVTYDNWQADSASAAQLTAHGLALQNALESGIFTSLLAGAFTAIIAATTETWGLVSLRSTTNRPGVSTIKW